MNPSDGTVDIEDDCCSDCEEHANEKQEKSISVTSDVGIALHVTKEEPTENCCNSDNDCEDNCCSKNAAKDHIEKESKESSNNCDDKCCQAGKCTEDQTEKNEETPIDDCCEDDCCSDKIQDAKSKKVCTEHCCEEEKETAKICEKEENDSCNEESCCKNEIDNGKDNCCKEKKTPKETDSCKDEDSYCQKKEKETESCKDNCCRKPDTKEITKKNKKCQDKCCDEKPAAAEKTASESCCKDTESACKDACSDKPKDKPSAAEKKCEDGCCAEKGEEKEEETDNCKDNCCAKPDTKEITKKTKKCQDNCCDEKPAAAEKTASESCCKDGKCSDTKESACKDACCSDKSKDKSATTKEKCEDGCCTEKGEENSKKNPQLQQWNRIAIFLGVFTVLFNMGEGIVSVLFGDDSGSISLLGFGIDSIIEVISGSLVLWRFLGNRGTLRNERIATTTIGALLALLGLGTIIGSIVDLVEMNKPTTAVVGLGITAVSFCFMLALYLAKTRAAVVLESSTMKSDAKCSLSCCKLSIVVFLGSGIRFLDPSLWWIDATAAIIISIFIAGEGLKTVHYAQSKEFSGGCGCCAEDEKPKTPLKKLIDTLF